MFQITGDEREILTSQFATLGETISSRKYLPFVFTENGVAMGSGVLSSDRAIDVNISIMRVFTRLRSFLLLEENLNKRIMDLNPVQIKFSK